MIDLKRIEELQDKLLTSKEAMAVLEITYNTLKSRVRTGEIERFNYGGSKYYKILPPMGKAMR